MISLLSCICLSGDGNKQSKTRGWIKCHVCAATLFFLYSNCRLVSFTKIQHLPILSFLSFSFYDVCLMQSLTQKQKERYSIVFINRYITAHVVDGSDNSFLYIFFFYEIQQLSLVAQQKYLYFFYEGIYEGPTSLSCISFFHHPEKKTLKKTLKKNFLINIKKKKCAVTEKKFRYEKNVGHDFFFFRAFVLLACLPAVWYPIAVNNKKMSSIRLKIFLIDWTQLKVGDSS